MNLLKLFTGNANPALAARGGAVSRHRDRQGARRHVQRRRGQRRDPGERARLRLLRAPADLRAGQHAPDGAPDHDRRAAPLVGAAHHRGDPLLRLRAPGPQGAPAAADHREARRRPDLHRGHRPPARASTCTRARSRASSTSRSTTCSRRRCCSTRSATATAASRSRSSRPTRAAWSARAPTPSASNASLAIIDKRREAANVSQVMNIIGDVEGRTCVIVDDIVDTAGTLTEAATRAQGRGRARSCRPRSRTRCSRARRSSAIRESSLDRARDHRHHAAAPGGRRLRADPRGQHRASALRGDPPHQQRRERELAVRLEEDPSRARSSARRRTARGNRQGHRAQAARRGPHPGRLLQPRLGGHRDPARPEGARPPAAQELGRHEHADRSRGRRARRQGRAREGAAARSRERRRCCTRTCSRSTSTSRSR